MKKEDDIDSHRKKLKIMNLEGELLETTIKEYHENLAKIIEQFPEFGVRR